MIEGRNVLVTGAAGSVAQHVISRILDRDPNVIRLFDNNEPGLANLKREFDDSRCRYLAGDVRDKDRLERAMEGIDVVVHTAAMKHVDICEYNPFEAVKTNSLGLQNVVDAAIDEGAERVVFTSSDKAAYPANTMGTTKLLGEKLITAGNKHSGRADLRLASVRFGNVLNSSHSVIPTFMEQIRDGGPITLTDRRMTRFFLTPDNLTDLVVGAMEHTEGGEVFVHKMPAVRIEDLAEAMMEKYAPEFDCDPAEIEIETIGPRPGETFHEEIMTDREARRALESESLYTILPEQSGSNGYLTHDGIDGFSESDDITCSSENATKLERDEIVDLLEASQIEVVS